MGQIGGMFGVSEQSGGTLEKFVETVRAIPAETSVPTLPSPSRVLATILGARPRQQADPGALLAVVGAIVASYVLDLQATACPSLGHRARAACRRSACRPT